MTLNRYAARVDSTQQEIVSALRAAGASVWLIKSPVDLLVGAAGRTALVECKRLTGKRKPKPTGYTPLQESFMSEWRGGPVFTVWDVEGALRALATMRAG